MESGMGTGSASHFAGGCPAGGHPAGGGTSGARAPTASSGVSGSAVNGSETHGGRTASGVGAVPGANGVARLGDGGQSSVDGVHTGLGSGYPGTGGTGTGATGKVVGSEYGVVAGASLGSCSRTDGVPPYSGIVGAATDGATGSGAGSAGPGSESKIPDV